MSDDKTEAMPAYNGQIVNLRNLGRARHFFELKTSDPDLIAAVGKVDGPKPQVVWLEIGDSGQKPNENQAPAEQAIPAVFWQALINETSRPGGWNPETRKPDSKLRGKEELTPQAKALRGYVKNGTFTVNGPTVPIEGATA